MKRIQIMKVILYIVLLLTCPGIYPQVTIGSGIEPIKGALLDLKEYQKDDGSENATHGVMLPRVILTDIDKLYPMFPSGYDTAEDLHHTGLIVYNLGQCDGKFAKGIYVWSGTRWDPLTENPVQSSTVTLTPGVTKVQRGDVITFTTPDYPSSKYTWDIRNATLQSGGGNTASAVVRFDQPDWALVKVEIENYCGQRSATSSITVTDPTSLPLGSGTLTGRTCFDINKSNWDGSCGTQTERAAAAVNFASNNVWTYTYTALPDGTTKTDLRFVIVDTEGCVKSYSGGKLGRVNDNEDIVLTVTYKPTLSDVGGLIYGRNKDTAATVTIYAVYNNGTQDVAVPLPVKIQDCTCSGCGAYISGVWKLFLCHNLGADTTLDPYDSTTQGAKNGGLNGSYYQWGHSKAAATATDSDGPIAGWNKVYITEPSWRDDPCPEGYRLPTVEEFKSLADPRLNSQIFRGSWLQSGETDPNNYSCGIQFSNVYLPAAGYRSDANGALYNRGSVGYYWTSEQHDKVQFRTGRHLAITNTTHYFVVAYSEATRGYSVRCIAK